MNKILNTKYGRAKIDNHGYYRITSGKEGNNGKRLHRLIWEDYHGKKIPEGYVVHHIDGNKLNNDIGNLKLMNHSEHLSHHHKGKVVSKEARKKMSESMKGEKNAFNVCIKIRKYKNKTCKQGFNWIAQPYNHEGQQSLQSVNLNKCIEKVEEFINSSKNTLKYTGYEVVYN